MKILPVDLPEAYINMIEENFIGPCISRPEHIRIAVRELIRKEFLPSKKLEEGAESDQTKK